MLSTLLATKLHRPRPTPNLVARPRLTQRLNEGLREGHRLTLVVAPAGYGKTTLVTEWLRETGMPSAWLSLDDADNDPVRFFAHIAAALQTLDLKVGSTLLEIFRAAPQSPEAFVYPLIDALLSPGAESRSVILALDDYHVITASIIQEAMVILLRRAPPNLHLVVLTRSDPPFPLPRLRVRERMTEIRDPDLRFTPEEMTIFLNSQHHLNLPAEQIAALEMRTEGWAAGVQLAALSLQGRSAERAAKFIKDFSGSHHYVVDYLFEEVLSRQPDAVRRFMLKTSILERMCAPLCEAVIGWQGNRETKESGKQETRETGKRGSGEAGAIPGPRSSGSPIPGSLVSASQTMLEYLDRANLFLIPLDDERRWYRYHHLFIDVLRQLLASASQPDHVSGLHGRASDWYRQNGYVADAYHHALLAGHFERAAGILEENAWSMVQRAEFATLKKWMQALPAESVSGRPWLCIYYAWAVMFAEPEAAEVQLVVVEQHLEADDTLQAPLRAEMQGHIAAIRAWIAYLSGDPDRWVVLARRALELWPQMDASVRSGLIGILGAGCRAHNDLTGAERNFAEAVDLAQASGNIMLEAAARTSLGRLSEMLGRLHEAEAIYQEALQRAILHKSSVAGQAYRFLADVYREWNDLESARLLAEKAIEPSRMWGHANPLVEGLLICARIYQAQNNISEANRALAEAGQVIRGHLLEASTSQWIGAIRARLWLAQGRLDEARGWAETRGLSVEGKLDLENEVEYLSLVRLLLAEGRVDEAMYLLSRLQSATESTGRHGNLIEVLVLQAVALHMGADTHSALAALQRSMHLGRPEGYVRVFLDAGEPMERLLKMAVGRWIDHELLAYARQLLAAFAEEGLLPAADLVPHTEILSERELEVLQLMAAGCSNREIADELIIALGTVKRHTANIFDKLDVRNRTEAVAKARQLGLL